MVGEYQYTEDAGSVFDQNPSTKSWLFLQTVDW